MKHFLEFRGSSEEFIKVEVEKNNVTMYNVELKKLRARAKGAGKLSLHMCTHDEAHNSPCKLTIIEEVKENGFASKI